MTHEEQRALALERAVRVKVVRGQLHRDFLAGKIDSADVLHHADMQTTEIGHVLTWARGIRGVRASRICEEQMISLGRKLGELTLRQKGILSAIMTQQHRAPYRFK